jgi:hypothetical protein
MHSTSILQGNPRIRLVLALVASVLAGSDLGWTPSFANELVRVETVEAFALHASGLESVPASFVEQPALPLATAFERTFDDADSIPTVTAGSDVLQTVESIGDAPERVSKIPADCSSFVRNCSWDGATLAACESLQGVGGSSGASGDLARFDDLVRNP